MSGVTKSHYEGHTTSSYESAYFYSPGDYMNYLVRLVQDRLGFHDSQPTSRILLDIGGGTGNFTRQLIDGCPQVQAVVVDPFLDAQPQNDSQIRFVKASAEQFASKSTDAEKEWRSNFHQALLKEVIHHLNDRTAIFRGIRDELTPLPDIPSLLIITRPQHDIDYPLWNEALQVWADNQPSLSTIEQELRDAGFQYIEHSIEAYPCSTSLESWLGMIQARFWSTFSNFSDDELLEACERIKKEQGHRVDEDGSIHFEDRLLFITAKK